MASFGEEVGRLMEEKGLGQKQLADRIGVHQTFISKLVRGERGRLGADVLYKLCDALGVGCDHFRPFLTDGQPQPAPTPEPPAKKKASPKTGKK